MLKITTKTDISQRQIGFQQGRKEGFREGRTAGYSEGRKDGFKEAIKYVVTQVENVITKEFGLASREELRKSDKLPSLWIAILMTLHGAEKEGRTKEPEEGPTAEELKREERKAKTRPKISSGTKGKRK